MLKHAGFMVSEFLNVRYNIHGWGEWASPGSGVLGFQAQKALLLWPFAELVRVQGLWFGV